MTWLLVSIAVLWAWRAFLPLWLVHRAFTEAGAAAMHIRRIDVRWRWLVIPKTTVAFASGEDAARWLES